MLDFDFEAPLAAKEEKHEEDVRRITGDSRRDARYDCSSGPSQETSSAPHLRPRAPLHTRPLLR